MLHYTEPDPCATIRCQDGYQCKIDGNGYCDPSCDLNNGGCPVDAQCALIPVQCITTPCPPTVHCDTGLTQYHNYCHFLLSQILVLIVLESVLPGTALNQHNACRLVLLVMVAVNQIKSAPVYQRRSAPLVHNIAQVFLLVYNALMSMVSISLTSNCTCVPVLYHSDFNGRCVPGMEYSVCSTLCEPTCDSYLSNESIACPAICVQGCVCPAGLIRYRDHCVSPLECTSLLNSELLEVI